MTTAQPAPTNSAIVMEQEASPEVAKRREALLESSNEVRELYERLVLSGTITAQEFWQSREVRRRSLFMCTDITDAASL